MEKEVDKKEGGKRDVAYKSMDIETQPDGKKKILSISTPIGWDENGKVLYKTEIPDKPTFY